MSRLLPTLAVLLVVGALCWAATEAAAEVPGERALIAWLDYTSDLPLDPSVPAGTWIGHSYRCDLDRHGTGWCPWRIRVWLPNDRNPIWRRDGLARMVRGGLTDPDVHAKRRGLNSYRGWLNPTPRHFIIDCWAKGPPVTVREGDEIDMTPDKSTCVPRRIAKRRGLR